MDSLCEDTRKLEDEFKSCRKLLIAVGDEMRQHLLCVMMESPCDGVRVVELAEKTNLSRPAVSHHMQILKDAGIVSSRKEGTCVYYYFDPDNNEIERLVALTQDVAAILRHLPSRGDE